MSVIILTGASGFIGSACALLFHDRGYTVRALVRNPEKARTLLPQAEVYQGTLPSQIDEAAFSGNVRALIHIAYETQFKSREKAQEVNENGTLKLLELVRKYKIPQFVFISSMAAHEEAESFYGQSKHRIEKILDPKTDLIIRPGTVLGNGGIFERTRNLIRKLPVLPIFYGGMGKMQTVWIGDLCEGIFSAVDKKMTGILNIAELEGVSVSEFYRGIAQLDGKNPVLLPFPGGVTVFILKLFEKIGLHLPITSENLLGIKHLKKFEVANDLARLGIFARNFQESLRSL